MADIQTLASKLQDRFSDTLSECIVQNGEITLIVPPEKLIETCLALRNERPFAFEMLMDVCGVDYSAYGLSEWQTDESTDTGFSRGVERGLMATGLNNHQDPDKPRFAVAYHLLSLRNNQRLRIRSYPQDSDFPIIDSVISVWSCADWFEREAFDLYGIVFEGHPDLRRILSDYGFIGHPFRKDYPLSGYVEMKYDEEKGRVVYQPVSIEPRVLVPKVIREDNRYTHGEDTGESSGA